MPALETFGQGITVAFRPAFWTQGQKNWEQYLHELKGVWQDEGYHLSKKDYLGTQ